MLAYIMIQLATTKKNQERAREFSVAPYHYLFDEYVARSSPVPTPRLISVARLTISEARAKWCKMKRVRRIIQEERICSTQDVMSMDIRLESVTKEQTDEMLCFFEGCTDPLLNELLRITNPTKTSENHTSATEIMATRVMES
jgi:hypothetical protein